MKIITIFWSPSGVSHQLQNLSHLKAVIFFFQLSVVCLANFLPQDLCHFARLAKKKNGDAFIKTQFLRKSVDFAECTNDCSKSLVRGCFFLLCLAHLINTWNLHGFLAGRSRTHSTPSHLVSETMKHTIEVRVRDIPYWVSLISLFQYRKV